MSKSRSENIVNNKANLMKFHQKVKETSDLALNSQFSGTRFSVSKMLSIPLDLLIFRDVEIAL